MKKTLVALAVTAFAASASAVTVYENEGTKVDVDGSLRLLLDNSGSRTKDGNGNETKKARNHTNLKNDGSRFGVRVKHDLSDDLFAFGRLELRFSSNSKTTDEFGDVYAHRAYVGLGSKQFGEVSFGRQVTIGDDISQAGFDNTYGVTKTPLTTSGKSVVRYDYKGIEGLQVGVDYRFAEDRKDGEVVVGKLKSGYGAGVTYGFDVAQGQSAKVAAGYTRDNYATETSTKHYRDAGMVGGSYTIDSLTLAADYGFENDKDGANRKFTHGLHTGAKYQVTPAVAVYGNYVYLNGKTKESGTTIEKERSHRFMLGTEYKVHKNVFTFIEGRIQETKTYNNAGQKLSSVKDNAFGVGLRVHW
ncbi:hypothetical protein RO21_11050 [[Actinobacillus] muris]|uniref:Porin domain-containing protein n=1 Tax=Muribacter muris TaxID=67855 RepID=A0A0J5P2R7_9PAST|nr:porin [Muribacter muris]KMK50551.1 hypothetical protein RO21_11050 [[Actinobacillus] muris] [Muribacter muris]